MNKIKTLVSGIAVAAMALAAPAGADTLDTVKSRGVVQCGVTQGLSGFSIPDDGGDWRGLDVDVCRAVAAAVFGDATKVKFTPLSSKERFTALKSGEIDVLSRVTTWTFGRDVEHGEFVGVSYYDGQGLMTRKSLNIKSARELDGASACTNTGTTTELNFTDYFRTHNMVYELVAFEKSAEALAAYEAGRCDIYTTDASGLYSQRTRLRTPGEHTILPEIISKEPLGPMVRHGDAKWADIVRWSLNAMIAAEEFGVSSQNVDEMKNAGNPEVRRMLGSESQLGAKLGLGDDWAYSIVKQVGNYGESFEKHLGPNTPLGIARGLNAQWKDGGLLYAPPFR